MRSISAIALILLLTPPLHGCTGNEGEDGHCSVPGVLQPFCGDAAGLSACDCQTQPIDLVAYVDLVNLPNVLLVSTVHDYGNGNDMARIHCAEGDVVVPESAYSQDVNERLSGHPIRAKVAGAYLQAVMLPGNGIVFHDWQLEIQSLNQIAFYQVLDDTTEVPIQP